jgi:hypothetical protein
MSTEDQPTDLSRGDPEIACSLVLSHDRGRWQGVEFGSLLRSGGPGPTIHNRDCTDSALQWHETMMQRIPAPSDGFCQVAAQPIPKGRRRRS